MKKIRLGINGFGRIGRLTTRILLSKYADQVEIVAVNDLTSPDNLAYLLQYDSTYHKFDQKVSVEDNYIVAGSQRIQVLAEKDPSKLPWKDLGVDVVIESTGRFVTKELASLHLQGGASKVILSAPAKDKDVLTVVQGVNIPGINSVAGDFADSTRFANESIISNASCTTNCLAPALKVLSRSFDLSSASAITVHAYTATQLLQDGPSQKEFRDGRAAAINAIPSRTGAAKAVALVLPELEGRLGLSSLRVPVITGSMVYLVASLKDKVDPTKVITSEEINQAFEASTTTYNRGILELSDQDLVSSDIIASPYSCVVDGKLTEVLSNNAKIMLWYDNEYGYSSRLAELVIQSGR